MSDYLRRHRRCLQTPVRYYRHPITGRRITLVGTMHVGEARYYNELRGVIAEEVSNGAIVQCEGSSQSLAADLAAPDLTDQERDALTALQRLDTLTRKRIAALGWVHQLEAMPNEPGWDRIDLGALEVLRLGDVDVVLRGVRRACRGLDWADDNTSAPNLFRLQIAVVYRLAASDSRLLQRRLAQKANAVVLHRRTAVALEGLHETQRDTVLIWGAKHLPGMDADLAARDYICSRETWHAVGQLPGALAAVSNIVRRRQPRDLSPTAPVMV